MKRWYIVYLLVPPLIVFLPLAVAFINGVARLDQLPIWSITLGAVIGYGLGAIGCYLALNPAVSRVATALAGGQEVSEPISDCLQRTEIVSAAFWVAWGTVMAMIGSALLLPTFRGVQVFAEASLIVSVPAMAWTYWGAKWFLLRGVSQRQALAYRGRVYSVGLKLGLVFIGFYVVSLGAFVQLIAGRLAYRLRQPNLAVDAVVGDIMTFGIGVTIMTALIFAAATYLLARDITGPIDQLAALAHDLAEGRFDTHTRVFSDDEIGRVSDRFAATQRNLRSLVGRMGSSGTAITDGVRVMNDGTESLLTGAKEQSQLAASSTEALSGVRSQAQSVLDAVEKFAEVTYDSASRASELSASSAEVARQMDELFQSVEKTSSSTTEIDASARETSRRTTDLAGFSAELLTFVAEMEATVDHIHGTASSTASIADQVRDNALSGRKAVQETVTGIRSAQESTRRTAGAFEALQKSLGQIDQILLLIEELTNRTNLLSFNAAIIAAQAGSQDFGFSVIADEIRQLADRTRGATKEIADIIRDVQPIAKEAVGAINEGVSRVDATVDLAQKTEQALASILDSADRAQEMSQRISRAMEEQSQATRHLHGVMSQTSEAVTEISRATKGQAEATRLLAQESERVRDIALHVKRASDEQTDASGGIAAAMEHIANDIRAIRDRLGHQLSKADEIAKASQVTLTIAQKNNAIAEQFSEALSSLVRSGSEFAEEVARFRV